MNIKRFTITKLAQFLNVLSGGRMYQHVASHCGGHMITDIETGYKILVSSTHHQMMMPSPRGLLVASSTLGGAREWYDGEEYMQDIADVDIEVVYYEHTNCLCFQPHPEFSYAEYEDMEQYFSRCVNKYLIKE